MTLEILGLLVTHRARPGSFGFVDSIEPLMVRWQFGTSWAAPERVPIEDLVITDCPDCGECYCWCGVER